MNKKTQQIMFIGAGIFLLVLFGGSLFSILGDLSLQYEKQVTASQVDYTIKSSAIFGLDEQIGEKPQCDNSVYSLDTKNNAVGGTTLTIDISSKSNDVSGGGCIPTYRGIKTVAKSNDLNLNTDTLDTLELDFNYAGSISCVNSGDVEGGKFRIALVSGIMEKVIYDSATVKHPLVTSVSQTGKIKYTKQNSDNYLRTFTGVTNYNGYADCQGTPCSEPKTLDFPNGDFEIVIEEYIPASTSCSHNDGDTGESHKFILNSIKVNGNSVMSIQCTQDENCEADEACIQNICIPKEIAPPVDEPMNFPFIILLVVGGVILFMVTARKKR